MEFFLDQENHLSVILTMGWNCPFVVTSNTKIGSFLKDGKSFRTKEITRVLY